VNKEVAHWLVHNSIDTLLIGLTGGELRWDNSAGDFTARDDPGFPLPPVLGKRFPSEPKWVDLRAYREGADKADAKFTGLAADFVAIRGVPKEDLLSQEVRQQRRALTLAWSAAAALLILAVAATAAGILAYRAEQKAKQTLAEATDTANKLVVDLARRNNLPWDAILGAEIARDYKPKPGVYLVAADAFDLPPAECMMVAAHTNDLMAAAKLGLRTGHVARPNEHGPGRGEATPRESVDVAAASLEDLAEKLGV
jgi:HAD superfamily hydrolase (TIGR01493 family)